MQMNQRPFLTGSHRYGKPTAESDIDLVVLITDDQITLEHLVLKSYTAKDNSPNSIGESIRYGKLNLIICTTDESYMQWYSATALCCLEMPVTKEHAKEIFSTVMKDVK